MKIVKTTKNGVSYLGAVLRDRKSVISRVFFWRIPHTSGAEDINLKIGRYARTGFDEETLESANPKSELTLDSEEFKNLLAFIGENYEPFKSGVSRYIPVDEDFSRENIEHIRALFRNPDKEQLLAFVLKNDVVPQQLLHDIEYNNRLRAITDFESMLTQDLAESAWQKWFQRNAWVLGSEFVRILDERVIDPGNIADYLVEAYDGFLDLIEIKRPGGQLRFWLAGLDHGNCVPSMDLVKAITQAAAYIFEVEREINSNKFLERVGGVRAVKPRCVLVYGRSSDWSDEQKRAFRILNSSYHNLSIMTYDHVLARAKRLLGVKEPKLQTEFEPWPSLVDDDEIPF
jgi:hypothetical protein